MNRVGFGLLFFFINICAIKGQTWEKCEPGLLQKHLENMEAKKDVSVSPCDDFYTYSCGNWDTTYFLRKLGARDTLTTVKAENKLLLIQYFDSTEDEGTLDIIPQLGSERKSLLDFYHSCVNLQFLDDRNVSIQTYANVLKRFSDWPILNPNFLESKANESFNWEYVSAELRRYGANTLWRTLVQPNWQNAEQLIIYIVPPSFDFLQRSKRAYKRGFVQKDTNNKNDGNDHDDDADEDDGDDEDEDDDDDDDEVFLYKTYVKYLLLDMGVRVRKALIYANEIVRFEQELMSLTEADENSLILKAPQTLASLNRELPGIRLQKFFDVLLQSVELPNNYERELLIVANKSYLLKLAKLLKKTKAETIGKYLLIQFLIHFEVNFHDEQPYRNRQEHCLQKANTFLPKELSSLFLDLKYEGRGIEFLRSAQLNLTQMFDNLKMVFESLINDTNVFDHDVRTREEGLEKLHAMQLRLPDLEHKAECNVFKNITLSSENYDLNYLYLSQSKVFQELLAVNKSLGALENSPQRTKNVHTMLTNYGPLDVNAYYRLKKNAIEIPVGLLSLPIYDNCLEAPMIYGTIAFIVGHELLHGFDYDGLNYDKTGNIADGWDPKSIIAYGTKASCYLGKRYDNAHTNVNENIADSEGLRIALGALQKVTGPLDSDDLKLFFTSFAHIWCRASKDHTEHHSIHATHRERVNNVLGNFQAFAETFECKSGSVMNPVEKCRIW